MSDELELNLALGRNMHRTILTLGILGAAGLAWSAWTAWQHRAWGPFLSLLPSSLTLILQASMPHA